MFYGFYKIYTYCQAFFVRFRKTQGEKNSSFQKTQGDFCPKTQGPGGFRAKFSKLKLEIRRKLKEKLFLA